MKTAVLTTTDPEGGLFLGVDGCRKGWITAVIDRGELRIEKYPDINSIIERYPHFSAFLIDMVIGLRDEESQVRPDDMARKELRPRGSTLFPVPSRTAVYADTYEKQKEENLRVLGKSLSKQASAIIPKIRETDEFMDEHPDYKNTIDESHPELDYARLNGEVLLSKKKDADGLKEREDVLRGFLPGIELPDLYETAKKLRCNADDIVDAVCLAVVATLKETGLCETIPEHPQKDENGLYMKLTVPVRGVSDRSE